MSKRDTLALPSGSPSKKSTIPKLKDIPLKIKVQFDSSMSLLNYQRLHNTNTTFLTRKLKINPHSFVGSATQQNVLVNHVKSNPSITISISPDVVDSNQTEEEFLSFVDRKCEEVLQKELLLVEELFLHAKDLLIPSAVKTFTELLTDQNLTTNDKLFIIKKDSKKGDLHIDWDEVIRPCIYPILDSLEDIKPTELLDQQDYFEFVDVSKFDALSNLLGLIPQACIHSDNNLFEEPSFICSMNDYECPSDYQSEVLSYLLFAALKFLNSFSSTKVGNAYFGNTDLTIRNEFQNVKTRTNSLISKFKSLEDEARKSRRKEITQKALINSKIIIDNAGFKAERLKLAIDEGIYPMPIYFETLTNFISSSLALHLAKSFSFEAEVSKNKLIWFRNEEWEAFIYKQHEHGDPVNETTMPSLLMLKVSQEVKAFFSSDNWLALIDIKDATTTFYSARFSVNNNYIVVSNYYHGEPVPENKSMIIAVDHLDECINHSSESLEGGDDA